MDNSVEPRLKSASCAIKIPISDRLSYNYRVFWVILACSEGVRASGPGVAAAGTPSSSVRGGTGTLHIQGIKMADNFGFAKLTKEYFDNVFNKLDPNMKTGDAKPYNELYNLFSVLEDVEEPAYEEMRGHLASAEKTIKKFLADKTVKGKPIEPGLKKLLTNVQKVAAAVAKAEKDYEKSGAADGLIEVDISVSARDFYNNTVGGAKLELSVDSKPNKVKLSEMTSQGNARFRGIMIEPSGNINVELTLKRKVFPSLSQNLGYKNITGKVLIIEASEEATTVEMTASSGKKVVDKKGIKGEIGVDYKIFSAKGEVSSERELEASLGEEVKFTVYSPKGTLILKQG